MGQGGRRDPLAKLVHELAKLPTIGEKTATRLAMFILKSKGNYAESLVEAIQEVKTKIKLCEICFSFTESSPCSICMDSEKESSRVAVVEGQADLFAIERSGLFNGKYHVLQGVLSPLDGIGPDDLRIKELLFRIQSESITEIILATNPSVEGEATAMYIVKLLKPLELKITRLAYGLPMGGLLEYADRITIGKAFENRVSL